MRTLANIYRLGVKELWSLRRDTMMLVLIAFTFTFSVYSSASSTPPTLNNAPACGARKRTPFSASLTWCADES